MGGFGNTFAFTTPFFLGSRYVKSMAKGQILLD